MTANKSNFIRADKRYSRAKFFFRVFFRVFRRQERRSLFTDRGFEPGLKTGNEVKRAGLILELRLREIESLLPAWVSDLYKRVHSVNDALEVRDVEGLLEFLE